MNKIVKKNLENARIAHNKLLKHREAVHWGAANGLSADNPSLYSLYKEALYDEGNDEDFDISKFSEQHLSEINRYNANCYTHRKSSTEDDNDPDSKTLLKFAALVMVTICFIVWCVTRH